MKKKYYIFLLFIFFLKPIYTQVQLSVYSEVSIITAGPGNELFTAFGHSAIRVKDPILNIDLIYNYGVFNFKAPNFYTNFAKGNLIYSLARYDFKYFLANYKAEKRWVKSQVLNLSQKERQTFFMYLENNARPENANYSYDPYFNNCATILRDITKTILNKKVNFNEELLKKNQTLRSLMHNQIHWNTWGSLGINLIAGTILDKKTKTSDYMYLPDYLFIGFKNATLNNKSENLIIKENTLLDFKESKQESGLINPFLIFSILGIIGIFITYKDFKNKKRTKSLDFISFFITGIIGSIIVFLWFFSSHSTAPNNFNILWAFAPNLIMAFILLKSKQKSWVKKYIAISLIFISIIPILWLVGYQSFPFAIIPLLVFLLVRYVFLHKRLLTFKI